MDSWLVFRKDRVILNQWTKRNDRSFIWFPKTSLIWGLPIRQEILYFPQIGKYSIESFSSRHDWKNGRGAFLYSAHCSFSNPIRFWSVWRRRAMIPGKIFTGLAKFQGIVSVNDFRLPCLAPKTFASTFRFPEKFLFCTIRLDPLGG